MTTARKSFEPRHRLWHEPPRLNYSRDAVRDEVQKEFKNIGKNLEFRTGWLDLETHATCSECIGLEYVDRKT